MPTTIPPLDLGPVAALTLPDHADHPAVQDWQAQRDAGRLGAPTVTPPAVAANRDATAALFRGYARARRSARP